MILEVLASLGLTFIIKQGRILNEIRSFLVSRFKILEEFFNCAMCIGFWAGIFIGIITFSNISYTILLAFTSSFVGFIIQHILVFMEMLYEKFNNGD